MNRAATWLFSCALGATGAALLHTLLLESTPFDVAEFTLYTPYSTETYAPATLTAATSIAFVPTLWALLTPNRARPSWCLVLAFTSASVGVILRAGPFQSSVDRYLATSAALLSALLVMAGTRAWLHSRSGQTLPKQNQ